jgi:hypothetical protein
VEQDEEAQKGTLQQGELASDVLFFHDIPL